jgi:sarcosine oxidase, subunit beta
MSGLFRRRTFLRPPSGRRRYDAIVIGGGGHGLAIAYNLARKHGMHNVAVLERAYIGSGGTGRNTTIVRANYKMPESVAFFRESLKLYQGLSGELDYNLLMSERGVFWLAHSESSVRIQRERALLNQALGVDTIFIGPEEVKRLCPVIDLTCGGKSHPILGSSYHPPGSVVRHDAVVWGYAAAAARLGVDVYQETEVTGINVEHGKVRSVETNAGRFEADRVVISAGGHVSSVARLAGVQLPIVTHPLQAFVTEPYRPVLDRIVASSDLLVYISQTARGEFLVGAEIERYTSYSTRSTFTFLQEAAARCLDLLPFMAGLRILRQWTGLCDMTPDYSPLMGPTEVDGLYVNAGWGTWGFKAIPAAGVTIAELVATGRVPELIAPFALDRFRYDRAIPDRSSAGTH